MRLSEEHIEIAIYPRRLLDLGQSKKSSFILGSIKTHKASIALQESSS